MENSSPFFLREGGWQEEKGGFQPFFLREGSCPTRRYKNTVPPTHSFQGEHLDNRNIEVLVHYFQEDQLPGTDKLPAVVFTGNERLPTLFGDRVGQQEQ
jgi:hypothetical protein